MMKNILLAGVAIATTFTFYADQADAFGGRGYARRQVRRVYHHHHVPAAVVVQRVYAAPVVRYHHAPVVSHYRAPVYYQPAVSVRVGGYHSYPSYGGVSVGIGW